MELPDEVVNKIIMFMSHPCADMIKKEAEERLRRYLTYTSESKIYQLYNSDKFIWEMEILKNKISLMERARIGAT